MQWSDWPEGIMAIPKGQVGYAADKAARLGYPGGSGAAGGD